MKKKKERREEGEEEERRKKRLRPVVVPWRAIYRTPDFFSSFFIPSPRASRDYLVSFSPFLSLSLFFFSFFSLYLFHLPSPSKVAACMLFIFLPALRSFSAPTSSTQRSVPPKSSPPFILVSPRFTCVYPAILLSNLSPFLLSLPHSSGRGGGAA